MSINDAAILRTNICFLYYVPLIDKSELNQNQTFDSCEKSERLLVFFK